MTATKKEAQDALNKARTKAQKAGEVASEASRLPSLPGNYNAEADAAHAYYRRCVAELEEAINDYAQYDNSSDEDS